MLHRVKNEKRKTGENKLVELAIVKLCGSINGLSRGPFVKISILFAIKSSFEDLWSDFIKIILNDNLLFLLLICIT